MDIAQALLDSWDRQCQIVHSTATLVKETNRHPKPSKEGWAIDGHLAHMHTVRRFFLSQLAPELAAGLPSASQDHEDAPLEDLNAIKECLDASGKAVREALQVGLENDGPMAGGQVVYDPAVLFLQHMVCHEGWHLGLIFLALRLHGEEPIEEWEEANVWGRWRTETW